MKRIKLTQGKFALVDNGDYDWINQNKWYYLKALYGSGYAVRSKNGVRLFMHREIVKPNGSSWVLQVDHIDGNGLNNQRKNLRTCLPNQNRYNLRKRSDNTSGFKGVSWNKTCSKWSATIACRKEKYVIGYFENKIDAAKAYDQRATRLFGEFAQLNFP